MGQRVVTSLNHFDFKKIKIKILIIIMQIKKGEKKHTGNHFLVTKKKGRKRGEEKKRKEKNI